MATGHYRPRLDQARGIAILAMIAYHFAWDLSFFGLVGWDLLGDPVWLAVRVAILAAFLGIAGVAQGLRGPDFDSGFKRRFVVIVGAALLVTAGSYLLFPTTFIWFGVLHCLAISSLLARPLSRARPAVAAAIGVFCLILPGAVGLPLFNTPILAWTGLGTVPPITNDWVPLLPFFGYVALGVAIGTWLKDRREVLDNALGLPQPTPSPRRDGGLALMGRHSLTIYLVHQPILLTALWLSITAGLLTPTSLGPNAERARFIQDCEAGCATGDASAETCAALCGCFAETLDNAMLARLNANILDPADNQRMMSVIGQCQAELGLAPE